MISEDMSKAARKLVKTLIIAIIVLWGVNLILTGIARDLKSNTEIVKVQERTN